ncbi:MAG: hypothetical protein HEP71_19260 [Roseivirga sp.]|nr:hypothetical protein [Roseivirga sp.]
MRKVLIFFGISLVLFSCKEDRCDSFPDISKINLELDFQDLTGDIHAIDTEEALASFLAQNPVVRDDFFQAASYKSEAEMLQKTLEILKNPYVDTLYQEVRRIFDTEKLRNELEDAFSRIKYFYPEFESPKVRTVYSGFGNDINYTDSLLVIGLDYYLGEEASFRPDEHEYVKVRLTPDHLIPHLVQFTSNRFNDTNIDDRTILDEMVFYGKALHFVKKILPCTPDSLVIGYNASQMLNSQVSEQYLWAYFVDNALLYDKKPLNIAKFIEERPGVPEIDRACPGRIGQWLGWRIVAQYEAETGSDFTDVMTRKDSREVLMQSKYRPRSR